MSEEKMLPCPACGSENLGNPTQSSAQKELGFFYVWCCDCGTCGPQGDEPEPTIHGWNALPRALRWTKEPPKKPGRYWTRPIGFPEESKLLLEVFDYDLVMPEWNTDCLWAGPIPEPQEAACAR